MLVIGAGAVTVASKAAEPLAASPALLPTTTADRQELEGGLADGGAAGIAAYLVTHRSPPALAGATRFTTVERHGTGSGGFRITGVPPGAGRATVLVVLRSSAVARTTLAETTAPAAVRAGRQEAGALTSTTVRFAAGSPPASLRIEVPAGVTWGAAVVLSD